ncbi:3'(2'),5'-bisphosphate nucleotidase CysQ [Pistricoccus aurantiacus]|uniref:3'(2'),5'-bisphosphate nucleotidase CysQ n=1 Tax=Pistricoccus aurantiacus TaxID=1883414 RepID=A0A5B8SVG0_9GAMM|nr:3'(2'),5'-bisphosphate nucleotidase CysQ [Pistricoccus aurantiacus]
MRDRLIDGVIAAGRRVMDIYRQGFDVELKDDQSPLTQADMASHHALLALLNSLFPDTPVLSEESEPVSYATRQRWKRYWLVDPLDGTKEFIKRNDEFTLNVALVDDGVPVFGIVHAPALGEDGITWWGQVDEGAFKCEGDKQRRITVSQLPDPDHKPWRVAGSRSHGQPKLKAFCAALPAHSRISMGSSLKFCLVAEGSADLYPRLAPTSEWDSAAAQAVVVAAGGEVLEAHSLKPLRYNQQDSLLNPFFIVCTQRDPRWQQALATALT